MLKPTAPALVTLNTAETSSNEMASQVTEYFPDVIFVHNRFGVVHLFTDKYRKHLKSELVWILDTQ